MNLDKAVELAIEHLAMHGLSDITEENLEKSLINENKIRLREEVRAKINCRNMFEMGFKPIQHLLTPKDRSAFDYRKAAIIDPVCLAKYSALVFMAATKIESHRIPVSKKIVFSCRFCPKDTFLFDSSINWKSWKIQTEKLQSTGDCKFVVRCDIASFYDRINIHRIESTLESIGVEKWVIKSINDLLLFWSKRDSYGIPVGNEASRILAEAALIDIDQYLMNEGVIFTRYVDDYRLFAPNLVVAQKWMNQLTNRLFRDGLILNTAKTAIHPAINKKEPVKILVSNLKANNIEQETTEYSQNYSKNTRIFSMPTDESATKFLSVNVLQRIKNLENDIAIVKFSDISEVVVACIAQEKFDCLIDIASLCSKCMYALDYFIDMLIKNREVIPDKTKKKIANYFSKKILKSEFRCFEWHEATIAKLLSNESYCKKDALMHIIKSSTKEFVTYPSVIALEGMFDRLTRSEFRTIREWFDRCDGWERRRLIYLSEKLLLKEEKIAWLKTIKPSISNDFLATEHVDRIIKASR
jgi:Reverse transcriptase (RNA-dependent DNA polymerase)